MAAIQKSISNKSWRGCGEKGTLNGTPLQYSCLENLMDRGAWKAAVHGIAEGRARLSDFTFTFHFHALEKEMATDSSILARRIPGTGTPGGLPSMGSYRVGHDWSDLAAVAVKIQDVVQVNYFLKYFLTFYKVRYFFLFCLWFCMLVFWGMNNSRLEAQVIDNTNLVGVMDSCMHQEFCFVGSFTEKHFAPCVLFLGSHSKS